jgi:hypothetical protein
LGRNDPCHCGSGKKYKKCHEAQDEARGREERSLRTLAQWVDFHSRSLCSTASTRAKAHADLPAIEARFFDGAAPADPFADDAFLHHVVFDLPLDDGAPLIATATPEVLPGVEAEAEDRLGDLRKVLAGTHASLLEVADVRRGRGLRLTDRLTGLDAWIADEELSERLDPLEVLVGRVLRFQNGNALLDGWSKVRFRGRKQAIAGVREAMTAAGLADEDVAARVAWLRSEAPVVYRHVRGEAPVLVSA